jgi:hypothetical protein
MTTDSDTEVLPPVTDLPEALAAAAPRRWRNRATPVLAGVAVVACAFLGGVAVQRQWGQSEPASTSAAGTPARTGAPGGPSGFPGGGFPAGAGPSAGGGFPAGAGPSAGAGVSAGRGETTTGTLTAVTADSLTVRTTAGGTVTVKIVGSTEVRRAATLAELRTGQPVTVRGSAATDGTITATAVTGS